MDHEPLPAKQADEGEIEFPRQLHGHLEGADTQATTRIPATSAFCTISKLPAR